MPTPSTASNGEAGGAAETLVSAAGPDQAGGTGAVAPAPAPRRRRRRGSRASSAAAPASANGSGEAAAAEAAVPGKAAPRGRAKKEAAPDADGTGEAREGSEQDRAQATRKRRQRRRPRQDRAPGASVPRTMLVTVGAQRNQIAVLESGELVEHYVARRRGADGKEDSIAGNVYLGKVQNVLPGMEAAFVDIGEERNAVIYAGELTFEEDIEGMPPRIEAVLKAGQPILAQVTKDPMRAKGARLTAEISLAGRYVVLVPGASSLGISRRLPDPERRRLREIAEVARPKGFGLILRTAAQGAEEDEIERDVARLVSMWEGISARAKDAKAPKLIYAEPEMVIRVVRDLFNQEVEEVVVDDPETFTQIKDYIAEVTPDLAERMTLQEKASPSLFEGHRVSEQIRKALDRRVWLKSGGHIVIDRTEAMTVVDVNTGRYVGKSTLEETVLKTNLEAADEIAKQLRLRDIGGIIVIDFIDMVQEKNREEVVRAFRAALSRDKTRTQVFGISDLGLLQMTRKKVSEGLIEAFSNTCATCQGWGFVLNDIDA